MKIFNWVHRRFSNKAGGSELGNIAKKKNGVVGAAGNDDKQQQFVVGNNVFELWNGGILTIGTFGYDPLNKDHHEQLDVVVESEKEQLAIMEYDDQTSDDDDQMSSDADDDSEEEEEEEEEGIMEGNKYNNIYKKRREYYFDDDDDDDDDDHVFEFEYVMMEKKERITLADLFSADSDLHHKKQPIINNKIIDHHNKQKLIKDDDKAANSKHQYGLSSLGKKLNVEDHARPIHKLHQMMRRMLKRKIHPDLSPLNNSKVSMKKCETNDYASLLPTQDATM